MAHGRKRLGRLLSGPTVDTVNAAEVLELAALLVSLYLLLYTVYSPRGETALSITIAVVNIFTLVVLAGCLLRLHMRSIMQESRIKLRDLVSYMGNSRCAAFFRCVPLDGAAVRNHRTAARSNAVDSAAERDVQLEEGKGTFQGFRGLVQKVVKNPAPVHAEKDNLDLLHGGCLGSLRVKLRALTRFGSALVLWLLSWIMGSVEFAVVLLLGLCSLSAAYVASVLRCQCWGSCCPRKPAGQQGRSA
ncbi:hypothetical protein HYH03_016399 [Edaphochlamys debaryana]|uniref:Uncharacterized protein n=1 Tax=Edaphochlamys debaryana TaxID=47281 RepID=A0A835XHM9_9CHLO|nr:hypothetical protein HYH03_016399 [Edaphochlamys debaryana]|eukprot:KAG2484832.1 hypothetical protein HYH03_016399 [Edaphochlamys debaryana]